MANQEHLNLLTQGVEVWNRWKGDTRETAPGLWNICYDADLSDADLRGADLSAANLGNVDLYRANFAGAHLVRACLAEAELAETNFAGACLNGADLSDANVCAADFSNADLSNADLRGADLSEGCFQGANLSGANLSRADLSAARLQGANLSGANFSEVYSSSYLEAYLHRAEIRGAKEAGAVIHQAHTERQGAKGRTRYSFKRKAQSQDIVLYTRINNRLLLLLGGSLLFVVGGLWMLQSPENLQQILAGGFMVSFGGLGMVVLLFQLLRQLFSHTPLLVINDEGSQYFCPKPLDALEESVVTHHDITLKWKEIGAMGFIAREQTTYFAVYASTERWRSSWSPCILLPQSLLPISVKQLIALIREHCQMQIEAYHIERVEIDDTPFPSHKGKKA